MARILFFDTETSGLDPIHNDILQLAYIIVDSKTWKIEGEHNYYFPYPEDESRVSPHAIEVNHLTKKFLEDKDPDDRKLILYFFLSQTAVSDIIVAHNLEFDRAFIEQTAIREKVGTFFTNDAWPCCFDTMKGTTDLCQIPSTNGYDDYKWPKLEELADFLHVPYPKEKLHDAEADVKLTFACFKKLCKKKYIRIKEDKCGNIEIINTPQSSTSSSIQCTDSNIPVFTMIEKCGKKDKSFKIVYNYLVCKVQLGIITPSQLEWLKQLDVIKRENDKRSCPYALDKFISPEDLSSLIQDYEECKRTYNI